MPPIDESGEAGSVEVVDTFAPDPSPTPAEAPPALVGDEPPAEPVADAPPAYAPNFKFKFAVKDKGPQEGEFDEWARSSIKSKEQEDRMRELYEKAHGLDFVKPRYMSMTEELKQIKPQFQAVAQDLQQLGASIKEGDFETALKMLNVDEDKILHWAANRVRYRQLPQEERARIDQDRELKERARSEGQRSQGLERQYETLAYQMRVMELDHSLASAETAQLAAAVDEKLGADSFKTAVVRQGQLHFSMTGKDLPVADAIREASRQFGPFVNSQPSQAGQGGMSASGTQARTKPPVLPNVASRNSSPTQQLPSSLAELRKMAKDRAHNEN